MKKTLALVLSIAMLFTLCVSAFAVDKTITQDTNKSVADNIQATISTSIPTDIIANGGYFTLTFPAETVIPWGKDAAGTSTALDCTVYTNLIGSNTLSVSVTAAADSIVNGENVMQNTTKTQKIPFTFSNASLTQNAFVNPSAPNWKPTVDITKAAWDNAPIGDDYSAYLTFSANIVAAP